MNVGAGDKIRREMKDLDDVGCDLWIKLGKNLGINLG